MNFGYGNGDVPPNRLQLQDPELIRAAQSVTSEFRTDEIREGLKTVRGNFDTEHFRKLHAYSMQDTFEWAGQTRQDLKADTGQAVSRDRPSMSSNATLAFAEAGTVNTRLDAISADLRKEGGLQGLQQPEFVKRLASYYDQYYQVAPFRAGNDAVLNLVTEQIAKQAGYEVKLGNNAPEVKLAADKTLAGEPGKLGELEKALQAITQPAPGPEAELARRVSLREPEVSLTRERHESNQTRELNQAGAFITDHISGRVGGKTTHDLFKQSQQEIAGGQISEQNIQVVRQIGDSLKGQGIDPQISRFEKATAELAELKGIFVERPEQGASIGLPGPDRGASRSTTRDEQER